MEQTRRVPRYPFTAPADVFVEDTEARVQCRVKELSLYGCYLDTPVPLAVKTHILLKIYGQHAYFEATATVIYAHPLLGMGIAFREVKPTFAPVLQKWLLASKESQTRADL